MPWSPVQAGEWRFDDVERVVAVGDVHGAYDALVATLRSAGVVDEQARWVGGKTHLVSTGDLVDRGAESRRVMDLMMRLEQEAARAGGRVHQLLGNHEVMNLNGDLRYVSDEEYAAFLDLEFADERELWYQKYREDKPEDSDETTLRRKFDARNPPGYFGHRRAFSLDGRYGKWLLGKSFLIVVNDTAYVHGGLPPYVAEHGLPEVNVRLIADLAGYVQERQVLQDGGFLSPVNRFREVPDILFTWAQSGHFDYKARENAVRLLEFAESPLHGPAGPTWYRGTAACGLLVEGSSLQAALKKIGANRVVVGHTTTDSRRVQQDMQGRVIEIDTGMLARVYGGSGNAFVVDNGRMSVINQYGGEGAVPPQQSLRVGHGALAIEEPELEAILSGGQVESVAAVGAGWRLLRLNMDSQTVLAVFREQLTDDGFWPELAAYRLDRLLGLGMVPVTVRRVIDGQEGTLQFVPEATLTERERVATRRGVSPACPMARQVAAMFVFDALIHNASRTPSKMLFDPDEWLLMLVDHVDAFGVQHALPPNLAGVELAPGEQWRTALRALDDDKLGNELGDVLGKQHLAALAWRRDALIALKD